MYQINGLVFFYHIFTLSYCLKRYPLAVGAKYLVVAQAFHNSNCFDIVLKKFRFNLIMILTRSLPVIIDARPYEIGRIMLDVLFTAMALLLIFEGIGPMLFPNKWQQFITQLAQQPSNQLRTMGGVLVTIGIVSLYYLLW